jgi:hypothetical protein
VAGRCAAGGLPARCRTASGLRAGMRSLWQVKDLRSDGQVAPQLLGGSGVDATQSLGQGEGVFGLGLAGQEGAGLPAHRPLGLSRPPATNGRLRIRRPARFLPPWSSPPRAELVGLAPEYDGVSAVTVRSACVDGLRGRRCGGDDYRRDRRRRLEMLGLDVGGSEDGAFWTALVRGLRAQGPAPSSWWSRRLLSRSVRSPMDRL